MYEVIVSVEKEGGGTVYARMEHKGRSEWKTKRIAEKHAREYKADHMRDAWVQEITDEPSVWQDPVFITGQKVVCKRYSGYNIKEGGLYEVVEYIPPNPTGHFTFPAYVVIVDDGGKKAQARASRFRAV